MFGPISKDNKRILGPLIQLERRKRKISQKQLLIRKNMQLCSLSTLYRIESGHIIKDDTIYHELISQFGDVFIEDRNIDNAISYYNLKLMQYFETLDLTVCEAFLSDIQPLLKSKSFYYIRNLK